MTTMASNMSDSVSEAQQAFEGLVNTIRSGSNIDRTWLTHCDLSMQTEDIDSGFEDGCTLLHLAASHGHVQATKLLVEFVDNVDVVVPSGFLVNNTPLSLACYMGELAVVQVLLEAGAEVNPAQGLVPEPLAFACYEGHVDIASVLIQAGADLNNGSRNGSTTLIPACIRGHVKIVELLLQSGVEMNRPNKFGRTALHYAAGGGHNDIVELLLDGAAINHVSDTGETALFAAAKHGHRSTVGLLLPHTDATICDEHGWSPLFIASAQGHVDVVRQLLVACDVNQTDKTGKTALHVAIDKGLEHVVAELTTVCSIHVRDAEGNSALDVAKGRPHDAIATILTEHVAIESAVVDIDTKGYSWDHRFEDQMTVLIMAARRGRLDVVRRAVVEGADINAYDKNESTALMWAAQHGFIQVVEFLTSFSTCRVNRCGLLDHGAGKVSPFYRALENKHYDVVCHLIANGATWHNREHVTKGHTVLELLASYLTAEVATNILLKDMPIAIKDGMVVDRIRHSFSWATFLDPSLPVDPRVRVRTVRTILLHPSFQSASNPMDVYKALTYATDKHGRYVLHSTDAATRHVLKELLFFCARYEIFDGPPIHVSATAIVVNAYDHGIFNQVFDMHANDDKKLDIYGFLRCSETLLVDYQGMIETPKKREEFAAIDKQHWGCITKEDYLRFCNQKYGGKLKVALKFMRNKHEFEREFKVRHGLHPKFVLHMLPSASPDEIQRTLSTLKIHGGISVVDHPHMLVLPAADRSLQDIHDKEYVSENKIRQMMEEVGRCLQHIHGRGIVHGDLKKLNILRAANRLQLIDMDAATVGSDQFAGGKWRSGILPPEMFYQLSESELDKYSRYWHGVDARVWDKVKPRGNSYVVKCFRTDNDTTDGILPYELEKTTPAMDMWAFGCLMFQMYSGEELVSTDRHQDATDRSIEMAASWSDKALRRGIRAKVRNETAGDLIERLLVLDPSKRLCAEDMFMHPYFDVPSDISAALKEDSMLEHTARRNDAKENPMATNGRSKPTHHRNTRLNEVPHRTIGRRDETRQDETRQVKRMVEIGSQDQHLRPSTWQGLGQKHVDQCAVEPPLRLDGLIKPPNPPISGMSPTTTTHGRATAPLHPDERSFLHAVTCGSIANVKSLLDKGNVHGLVDEDGNTPLHLASANSHVEIVAVLLPLCRRDLRNKAGQTAMEVATMKNLAAASVLQQFLLGGDLSQVPKALRSCG
ncbi:Aste57867_16205 [Aphanomyces stellatus]|uniref:Aste57867_16205 protein n=1 Tax=Aphanomyces stellatus TaxID=120398 RepID=A0A485L4Y0_9STRA|nr:hypothetical protein As57867_016149 [Aphanomyces stellatus]VFT92983.1 Aste57867_16205 [Aphanomyces stellatus]